MDGLSDDARRAVISAADKELLEVTEKLDAASAKRERLSDELTEATMDEERLTARRAALTEALDSMDPDMVATRSRQRRKRIAEEDAAAYARQAAAGYFGAAKVPTS